MGLPVFIKMGLFMAAVFISNIVQALTGFAGVMLSIPPTILLYGPDMAKAVINVICWLVCAYLMVKNREYINKKELGRIILFMLIGMAAGIYLYNIVDARILVPVYGLLIVGVALKKSSPETVRCIPSCLGCHSCSSRRGHHPWHVCFRRRASGRLPGVGLPG